MDTEVSRVLPLARKVERAGVIPVAYTSPNTLLICMGVDTESGDMSDWGGKVEEGETNMMGAVRELKEESLKVFDFSVEYISDNCIYKGVFGFCTVYFVVVPLPDLVSFPGKFTKKYNKMPPMESEMSAVKLMFASDIYNVCNKGSVYYIVAKILLEFIKSPHFLPPPFLSSSL